MKKVLSIIAIAAMAGFVACGPSAEEKSQLEEDARKVQDSIAASINEAMQNEAEPDSTSLGVPANTETADTVNAVPAEEGHEGHNH